MTPDRPTVISITSLPSRIGRMRPVLESLLRADARPQKILIPLPSVSIREQCSYSIPDFLKDRDFCGDVVQVVAADHDWGPGTKLLGVCDAIPPESYLVLADDDVRYHPSFLKGILAAQRSDHSSSFSYHVYRARGLTVGQGCDGFSFWSPNLAGVKDFAERHVVGSTVFFHDDLWISFFLAAKGIQIKAAAPPRGAPLIYAVEHHVNSLNRLSGDLSRRAINRSSIKRLLREVPMAWQIRARIRLTATLDQVWTNPLGKLRRRIARARAASVAHQG